MSPTLSPSPAHRPHHLPGRPPDLCGSSSRPMPCTCSPCGRLTIRTAGNPPRSEKEAFPVTKKYLLNAHEVLGAVGTWGNTLSPRSQEMPARQVRSREARSLAHGHPRWQWQSQDEVPGLAFPGRALPDPTPAHDCRRAGELSSFGVYPRLLLPRAAHAPQTHHCFVSIPLTFKFTYYVCLLYSEFPKSRDFMWSCCTLGT